MFIVLEEVDGTGKSTIRQRLFRELDPTMTFTHGKHAWFDITAAREIIHSRTFGSQDFKTRDRVLRAYMTDKTKVAQKLTSPALAAGYHVIADRYALSEIVYLNVLHDIPINVALEK
jgi:thymidylate kinase